MPESVLKISDFIKTENIFLKVKLNDKEAVLRFVAEKSMENGVVENADQLFEGLSKREESMSTGVGGGLAFPHATTTERDDAAVLILQLLDPIPFDAIDNQNVDIIFSIVIPETNQTQHLQILARVSRLVRKTEFTRIARSLDDPEKLKNEITRLEEEITEYFYDS